MMMMKTWSEGFWVAWPLQWAAAGHPSLHPSAGSAPRSPRHTTNTGHKTTDMTNTVPSNHRKQAKSSRYLTIWVRIRGVILYQFGLLLEVYYLGEEVCDLLLLSGGVVTLLGQLFRQRWNLQVGITWKDQHVLRNLINNLGLYGQRGRKLMNRTLIVILVQSIQYSRSSLTQSLTSCCSFSS